MPALKTVSFPGVSWSRAGCALHRARCTQQQCADRLADSLAGVVQL